VMERTGTIDAADGLALRTLDVFGDELGRLMPDLEALLVYVWRRAIATAVTRAAAVGGASPDGSESGVLSVGFADMVGYTRLSRRLPEDELARLVQRFEAVSSDIVAACGGRLVKTVGDEVLFVATSADQAADIAVRLHTTHAEDDSVPEMRIGLATGQVLSRMGDVFGTTVNLASRLTALAKPGATLVDAETKAHLEDDQRYLLRGQRGRAVRGFGVLRAFVLTPAPPLV
jgi:adenylate cyclase